MYQTQVGMLAFLVLIKYTLFRGNPLYKSVYNPTTAIYCNINLHWRNPHRSCMVRSKYCYIWGIRDVYD